MSRAALVPMFVYGSLRAGGGLERLLPAKHRQPADLIGASLWRHPQGFDYPVLTVDELDLDPLMRVTGELLLVPERDSRDAVMMELLAGYEARWVKVWTDDGEGHDALVFAWPINEPTGSQIESGDWLAAESEYA